MYGEVEFSPGQTARQQQNAEIRGARSTHQNLNVFSRVQPMISNTTIVTLGRRRVGLWPEPWEGKPVRSGDVWIAMRGGDEGDVTAWFGGDEGAKTST